MTETNKNGIIRDKNINIASVAATRTGRKPRRKSGRVEPKELLVGYESIARKIQSFMYEGRPKRSRKKVHTAEELENFLVQINEMCWELHNEGHKKLADN